MKALFPPYCRPLGYGVLLFAILLFFVLLSVGVITDGNLLFYKECTKILLMCGCLLILFAYTANENHETEEIRNKAGRNAIFLTCLFLFGSMAWRVMQGDVVRTDTSSFLTFLIIQVLCLEFGLKKKIADQLFRKK